MTKVEGGGHDNYDHLRESADDDVLKEAAEMNRIIDEQDELISRARPWPDDDEEPKGVDSIYTIPH